MLYESFTTNLQKYQFLKVPQNSIKKTYKKHSADIFLKIIVPYFGLVGKQFRNFKKILKGLLS